MDEIKQFLMTRKKANLTIVIINIVVFIVLSIIGDTTDGQFMVNHGAAFTPYILAGDYYRLFTSMFLHFGIEHLINNMLVLFVLGSRLERVIGKLRFIVIYLAGGMTGSVLSLVWDLRQGEYAVSAGASGAVFAVMGAMIYVVIRNKGRLEDLSVRQILVMAVFSLYFGFASSGVDNAAHTGGLAAGFLLAIFCYHRRKKI